MIAEQVKPGGADYSADTWHTYFKARFIGADDVKMPNGKTLILPKSTATLDVAEFGEYFTKVDAWAAERGIWLADMETT